MALIEVLVLFTIATIALYRWRGDFSRYSIFTFERGVSRVEREVLRVGSKECSEPDCSRSVHTGGGEHRTYWREDVALGLVVRRYSGGVAYACSDHAAHEIVEEIARTGWSRSRTTRLGTHEYVERRPMRPRPQSTESPFADVIDDMAPGLGMFLTIPVVIMAAAAVSTSSKFVKAIPEESVFSPRLRAQVMGDSDVADSYESASYQLPTAVWSASSERPAEEIATSQSGKTEDTGR